MQKSSAKPLRTARELRSELDHAAQSLSGDYSPSRIMFGLPALTSSNGTEERYNWDVEASCRPEQDETAQAAVQYVADKWNLAAGQPTRAFARPAADAVHRPAVDSSSAPANTATTGSEAD